jgi:hypothetical protein
MTYDSDKCFGLAYIGQRGCREIEHLADSGKLVALASPPTHGIFSVVSV